VPPLLPTPPPGWVYSPGGVLIPETAAAGTATTATTTTAGSAIVSAAGAAAFAVLVAELYALGTAIGALSGKSALRAKEDELNELTDSLLSEIVEQRDSGQITAAKAQTEIDNLAKSRGAVLNLLAARAQQYQKSLDENVLIRIGEWFQDTFSDALPSPPPTPTTPGTQKMPRVSLGTMDGSDVTGALASLSDQPASMLDRVSLPGLVAATDPEAVDEVVAYLHEQWRDEQNSDAARSFALRGAQYFATPVDDSRVEFWRDVYDASQDDVDARKRALLSCYRATTPAAWEFVSTVLDDDDDPVTRVLAFEILGSLAAATADFHEPFLSLATEQDDDTPPDRRLGGVCGTTLLLGVTDRRVATVARNHLLRVARSDPTRYIAAIALGALVTALGEDVLLEFVGADASGITDRPAALDPPAPRSVDLAGYTVPAGSPITTASDDVVVLTTDRPVAEAAALSAYHAVDDFLANNPSLAIPVDELATQSGQSFGPPAVDLGPSPIDVHDRSHELSVSDSLATLLEGIRLATSGERPTPSPATGRPDSIPPDNLTRTVLLRRTSHETGGPHRPAAPRVSMLEPDTGNRPRKNWPAQ
jgi:hypothetical protein